MFAYFQVLPLSGRVAVSILEVLVLGAFIAQWAIQMLGAPLHFLEEAGFRVGLAIVMLGLWMVAGQVTAD